MQSAWTRRLVHSGRYHLPLHSVHYTALLPSRDLSPRVSHRALKEQKALDVGTAHVPVMAQIPSAPHVLPISCCPTTAKVEVVEESCGHFQGPVNPASHQEIRTSRKRSTDRLEIFPSPRSWPLSVLRSISPHCPKFHTCSCTFYYLCSMVSLYPWCSFLSI